MIILFHLHLLSAWIEFCVQCIYTLRLTNALCSKPILLFLYPLLHPQCTGNVNTWNILWHIEGRTFLSMTAIQCVALLPGLAAPKMLGELATVFEDDTIEISYGIYLALGLLAIGLLRVGLQSIFFCTASRVISRVKALVSYAIYYKALHISTSNDGQMTTGQTITLLSADSNMVAMAMAFIPMVISNVAIMCFVCVLLHIEIGVSALAGWMFVLLVSFPMQSVVGSKIMTSWKAYIGESDNR